MLNVVGAVLMQNNKILLPKRSANLKKMPNKYEFPGGKIEESESFFLLIACGAISPLYSTVTTFAKLRGLSGFIPFSIDISYASFCNAIVNIISL